MNERICCVRTYPTVPKDVIFSAFKQKYLRVEFLTFLKIAIYGIQQYAMLKSFEYAILCVS